MEELDKKLKNLIRRFGSYVVLLKFLKNDNFEVAKILLRHGAKVNVDIPSIPTPLHLIAAKFPSQKTCSICVLLLARGAKVSAVDQSGSTPLHYAAKWRNDAHVFRLIFDRSEDVYCVNNDGETPLHVAAREYNQDAAKLLLSKDADINISDKNGLTPLHYASKWRNSYSTFDLLLSRSAVNAVSGTGDTPLHIAAKHGSLKNVEMLLSKGGNVNAANSKGERPLHVLGRKYGSKLPKYRFSIMADMCCEFEYCVDSRMGPAELLRSLGLQDISSSCKSEGDYYVKVINVLLEHGAEIDAQDELGETPLHIAVAFSYVKMAKILMSKGCSVNKCTKNNLTALHFAARTGHLRLAKLLFENGADLNATSQSKCTPLDFAIKAGHTHLFEFFLEQRPTIKAENKDDVRLLHLAIAMGLETLVKKIFQRCSDVVLFVSGKSDEGLTSLHVAAQHGHLRIVELLLSSGADVNAVDKAGNTPLYYASRVDVREFLLEKGATGKICPDILPDAIKESRFDLVNLALQNGANLNARNDEGMTALHVASSKPNEEVVHLLLERGADIDTRDTKRGYTALHFAASTAENKSVIKALLESGSDIDSQSRLEEIACLSCPEDELVLDNRRDPCESFDRDNSYRGNQFGYRNRGGRSGHVRGYGRSRNVPLSRGGWSRQSTSLLVPVEDTKEKTVFGETPLCAAVNADCSENVDVLLKYGADVNIKYNDNTPFRIAVSKCRYENSGCGILFCTDIVCLKTAGIFVNDSEFSEATISGNCIIEIEKELVELKSSKIGTSNATFYDFLVLSPNKSAVLYDKENIEKNSNSGWDFGSRFPRYNRILHRRLVLAGQRLGLLNKATALLEKAMPSIPDLCIDEITDYLSNRDLKMIIRAYSC